jgi:hypothetical protein
LAPGPTSSVLRKPCFLTSESSLSLKQKILLLKCVVRLGNANPPKNTVLGDLDLTVQKATYSVGGSDLGCPKFLVTTEYRHFFRLLEPV